MTGTSRETGTICRERYKPYSSYKDSGVEWLGEIPRHWEVRKIKRLALVRRGASPRPIDDPIYFDDEGEYAWVRIADVTASERYLEETTQRLSALGKSKSVALEPGDLFLSIAATVGKPVITRIKCCIHDGFVYFVGLREDREYLYYLFSCGEPYKGLGKLGTQLNLNTDSIGDICLPLPSRFEQCAIVQFLDRETARIDTLVAKKERLIELLQEKRTALLTRAVTKGLDPNVPMKDSGVEWLGEIPAHWEAKPFTKYVSEKSDYRGKTPEKVTSGVFLVTAKNVRMGLIDYECSQEFVAEQDYIEIMRRGLPKKGDVLFTTEAPLGNVALVDREDIALAQRIIRFRMDGKHFESRFTLFAMMSDYFQSQLFTLSTGSTAKGLKASKLPMLRLVAPPINEQSIIVDFLDREIAKMDGLVVKVRGAIARLKELRTALISAAVTGKIDVRPAVTPAEARVQ